MDWSGSMCTVHTDDATWFKLGQENALILMNHSNELDWLVGWIMADQVNILGVSYALNDQFTFYQSEDLLFIMDLIRFQNAKLFIKKAVEWIPIIGWAWKFGEIGFLERNWEKDKSTMDSFVKNIKEYEDPVWVMPIIINCCN